jgi:2-aminomuconate deaminase
MNDNRNDLTGRVLAYEALHGAGGAVVHLDPTSNGMGDKEYDEDDVEVYHGERNVLDAEESGNTSETKHVDDNGPALWDPAEGKDAVNTDSAPKPVGLYPHARRVGDLLYLSGVGPRQPGTNAIPGGPIRDTNGEPLEYDIKAQTRAVVENIARILEEADMDRDFAGYNEVWADTLGHYGPTRTTLAIRALPTPIAVEMKVIAKI